MKNLNFKIYCNDEKNEEVVINLKEAEFNILNEPKNCFITNKDGELKIEDSFFSKESIVNDEIRYKINVHNRNVKKEKIGREVKNIKLEKIVLLLESPHSAEYKIENDKLVPIGPAQGNGKLEAGGAIEEYIEKVLEKIDLEDGSYLLIIANPIRYQTSLNSIHKEPLAKSEIKELRNIVWKNIWYITEIREDFFNRLKKYDPIKIINACTAELQTIINYELVLKEYKKRTYITTHPAITWSKDINVGKLR